MSDLTRRQEGIFRSAAETGVDPSEISANHPEAAFGEKNEDHSEEVHNYTNGYGSRSSPDEVGSQSREQTDRFYDRYVPEDLSLKKRN